MRLFTQIRLVCLSCWCFFVGFAAQAQNPPEPVPVARVVLDHPKITDGYHEFSQEDVEQAAKYLPSKGESKTLQGYIKKHLKHPTDLNNRRKKAKVVLKFEVEKDGSIGRVECLSAHTLDLCEQEAIRLVKSFPRWQPARVGGFRVKSTYKLSFDFK